MKLDELLEGLKDLSKDYDENRPDYFDHFTGDPRTWSVEMTRGARKLLAKHKLFLDDTYSDVGTSARHGQDHDTQTLRVKPVREENEPLPRYQQGGERAYNERFRAAVHAAMNDLEKVTGLRTSVFFSEQGNKAWISVHMKPIKD